MATAARIFLGHLCFRIFSTHLHFTIHPKHLCIRVPKKVMRVYCVLRCLQPVIPSRLATVLADYAGSVIEMLLMMAGDVEPNPGPTTLSVGDLREVKNAVWAAREKWKALGLELQLVVDDLDNVEGDNNGRRLEEMLKMWLKRPSLCPSWESLIAALKQPTVGEEDTACKIELEHLKLVPNPGAATPCQALPQAVPSTSTSEPVTWVKDHIVVLQKKHSNLAHRCYQSLRREQVDGEELTSCLMVVSVHLKELHEEFLEDVQAQLKDDQKSTFHSVWWLFAKYCDFLNYELLEHVIHMYGPDTLQEEMGDYVTELRTFRRKAQLCDFVQNWPTSTKPPDRAFKKLVVKMDKPWNRCTLEDVELFRQGLTQTFLPKKSLLLLKEIDRGCVQVTWYIPTDTAIELQRNLQNTRDRELFKIHRVEWLTVDGQECYYSPVRQYANFLKDTYTSESPTAALTSAPPSDIPLHFKLAKIEREQISIENTDPFTQSTLRGNRDDILQRKTPISFADVGKLPENSSSALVLIEGAPGVGKSTFSWEYCRRWARGELLQRMSLVLLVPLRDNRIKAATNLTDLFYHSDARLRKQIVQELWSSQGESVVIWLEGLDEFGQPLGEQSFLLDLILAKVLPKATIFITSRPHGSHFLLQRHKEQITQHVEILGSPKEQIEAVAKSDTRTSIGKQFLSHVSENPVIKAAMYTPVTTVMMMEVFNSSLEKNTNPPTTMTELYTAYTCKRLSDYVSHHPRYDTQQWTIYKFADLPPEIHFHFRKLCELAYIGIENNQQIIFSEIPPGLETLGLLQEVQPLYTKATTSPSYNFTHLTLQEYLAAVHLSELLPDKQTTLIQKKTEKHNSEFGNYTMVFRFLCGLTKMIYIPPLITDQMLESEAKLDLFHWMYEAQDYERTARTLGQAEIEVESHYSWTPLDYYVTGYCISHSNCPWGIKFFNSLFDDEKMEMLSKGCCNALESTYTGYITEVDFSHSTLTSKGIGYFTQLPKHILQSIRVLELWYSKLDREACNLLATTIPTMKSVGVLHLDDNPLHNGGAVELISALCGHIRLRELYLHSTYIGEEDCKCLFELLVSSQSITHLSVSRNNLSPASMDNIISGLSHNGSLTYLEMEQSKFSEDNTVHLSTVLRDNNKCMLKETRLAHCNITGSGACHLAESLHTNSTLKTLALDWNPIEVGGATAIAAMLLVNTSLENLVLSDCSIGPDGACELASALHTNSTLKILRLNNNTIEVDGATAIAAMLLVNRSLEVLRLDDGSIGEEGVVQLVSSLEENKTLKKLYLPRKYKQSADKRVRW